VYTSANAIGNASIAEICERNLRMRIFIHALEHSNGMAETAIHMRTFKQYA
jgi:hypothetical protein